MVGFEIPTVDVVIKKTRYFTFLISCFHKLFLSFRTLRCISEGKTFTGILNRRKEQFCLIYLANDPEIKFFIY